MFLCIFLSVCKSALRKLRDIFEHTSFFKNYDVLDILQVWTKRKVASISSLSLSSFMLCPLTPDGWNSQKKYSFDSLTKTLNKTRLPPPIYELIYIPVIHQKKLTNVMHHQACFSKLSFSTLIWFHLWLFWYCLQLFLGFCRTWLFWYCLQLWFWFCRTCRSTTTMRWSECPCTFWTDTSQLTISCSETQCKLR